MAHIPSKMMLFELVLPLLDGHSLTRLYLTGDLLLQHRMASSSGVRSFELDILDRRASKFPAVVSRFSSLQRLRISVHPHHLVESTFVMTNMDLSMLPRSLESLKLHFGNASLLFIDYVPQTSSSSSLSLLNDISMEYRPNNLVLQFKNLRAALPHLRELSITDSVRWSPRRAWELCKSDFTDYPRIDVGYMMRYSLPTQLETLDLVQGAFLLPPHLQYLPSTLTSLFCVLGGGSDAWDALDNVARFPSSLTRLVIKEAPHPNVFYLIPPEHLCNLSLDYAVTMEMDEDPGDGSLADFEPITDDSSLWKLLVQFVVLRSLHLGGIHTVGESFARALPRSLTSLSLSPYDTILASIFAHMPSSLTSLYVVPEYMIRFGFNEPVSFPDSLRHLDATLPSDTWTNLPPKFESVNAQLTCVVATDAPKLPSHLKSLSVLNITAASVSELPTSITSLEIGMNFPPLGIPMLDRLKGLVDLCLHFASHSSSSNSLNTSPFKLVGALELDYLKSVRLTCTDDLNNLAVGGHWAQSLHSLELFDFTGDISGDGDGSASDDCSSSTFLGTMPRSLKRLGLTSQESRLSTLNFINLPPTLTEFSIAVKEVRSSMNEAFLVSLPRTLVVLKVVGRVKRHSQSDVTLDSFLLHAPPLLCEMHVPFLAKHFQRMQVELGEGRLEKMPPIRINHNVSNVSNIRRTVSTTSSKAPPAFNEWYENWHRNYEAAHLTCLGPVLSSGLWKQNQQQQSQHESS